MRFNNMFMFNHATSKDALVIPGGRAPEYLRLNKVFFIAVLIPGPHKFFVHILILLFFVQLQDLIKVVQSFKDKPIASICHGQLSKLPSTSICSFFFGLGTPLRQFHMKQTLASMLCTQILINHFLAMFLFFWCVCAYVSV